MKVLETITNICKQVLTLLGRAFAPPGIVVALAVPIIGGLMAWVFLLGNKSNPVSYGAYVICAYLFVVLCLWCGRHFPRQHFQRLAAKNRVTHRALEDPEYRRWLFIAFGLGIDVLWAVANLAGGVFESSVWLITLGLFYLLCALMRGSVFLQLGRGKELTGRETGTIERLCGILLLLAVLVLSGIVCLVIKGLGQFTYEGVLIYAVATFAFYSLIMALVNYARLRKHSNRLVVVNCRINLAVALVAIFALEVAMLAQFSTAADKELVFVAPILTGLVIACVIASMGLRCLVNAGRARG